MDGWVETGWERLEEAFADGQRDDPGHAQLAVYHHGRLVSDLWAGDSGEHIGILMSVSKGLVATCAHMLAQQGALDLDRPVSAYWPEFAAAGKQDITVAHVLSHRAGLPAFDPHATTAASWLLDWDEAVKRLAAQSPAWTPGQCHFYHPFTFGHLIGEVIRRVSGDTVGAFFHRHVAEPLGLSVWIGLPDAAESRFIAQSRASAPPTAEQIRQWLVQMGVYTATPPGTTTPPGPTTPLSATTPLGPTTPPGPTTPLGAALEAMAREGTELVELFGTRAGRAAQVPAANAVGDARSVARFYAAVIGEVDGVRLLSPPALARAVAPQTDGVPGPGPLSQLDGPDRSRFGLGFELPRPGLPMLGPRSFGHAGAGGRLAYADPESGITVAYTCTHMAWDSAAGPDPRWLPWTRALQQIVSNAS